MRMNVVERKMPNKTHEGGPAYAINPEQQLRRSVMSCLLWEREFYEDGKDIAQRIADLVPQIEPGKVAAIAIEARSQMHLRHVPLLLVREMARHKSHRIAVRYALGTVIQRADELAEFLAIYWKDGKVPLAKSVQKGLADAFTKFNAYQLAKYNRDGAVKLRDVLFLSHAKPRDVFERIPDPQNLLTGAQRHTDGQAGVWAKLVANELPAPDTWEVELSAGKDKRATWERLIAEQKLGGLATLRNLRNMQQAGVTDATIRQALTQMNTERVLPFRFLAAARFAPGFISELDAAMMKTLQAETRKLTGSTIVLVDVSGSMDHPLSAKSDMHRIDAAAGLAVLARELCEHARTFTFSNGLIEVPAYRGLALAEAVKRSQPHGSTNLGSAMAHINRIVTERPVDRIIVITDEQSHDRVPGPNAKHAYMINVASAKNGVGYGPWTHIDGWSDRVLDYIRELEAAPPAD
jgi:hypothetical protein